MVVDGNGIIDLRISGRQNEKQIGGNCPNILDVCCKTQDNQNNENLPPKPNNRYQPKCGNSIPDDTLDIDIRIYLDKNEHGFDNIAQFGAYPWMAAILRFEEFDQFGNTLTADINIYQCGASLIHPQVVLTAAHCVDE